ncbi:hypothetical protein K2X30_02840 [bacterium]|nr:hypothetical protein [bacterium]
MPRTYALKQAILSASNWLARSPEETSRLEGGWSVRSKYALFGVACLGFFAFSVFFIDLQIRNWVEGKPAFPVARQSWKVFYGDQKGLELPSRKDLWGSSFHRGDAAHLEKVRALQGKVFWVGTTIDHATVQAAIDQQKTSFILGFVSGTYQIWINGHPAEKGNYSSNLMPIILRISPAEFSHQENLQIAVRIEHDVGNLVPDYFNAAFGGEGFSGQREVTGLLGVTIFHGEVRPFAFALVQLVLALLFFFFWISAKRKQEYFYMACFVLVQAWFQARQIDFVFRALEPNVTYSLDLVLRIYDGVFALFLGLSFARTSRAFFQYALPMFLFMPLAVLAMPFPDASSKMFFSASLGMFFVPICYWSASVICLLQAAYLKLHHGNHFRPVRRNRLLFFGMTLAVLGTITYLRASGLASPNQFEVASRFIPLALVLLLGGVVVLEYSETEKAVRVSHLSKYHKRPILPTRVPGVMLKIDLKESTVLEKEAGARSGAQEYGKLSTVWFSMMAQVVFEFGGEIIKEEGDSLIAFFDSESQKNPLLSAVWAAQKMSSSQAGLSQVFEMLGLDPAKSLFSRGDCQRRSFPSLEKLRTV